MTALLLLGAQRLFGSEEYLFYNSESLKTAEGVLFEMDKIPSDIY